MSITEPLPAVRNGVDTDALFATLDAVRAAPEAAAFQFRVENRWVSGTHSVGHLAGFFGVGEEQVHQQSFQIEADHPGVLVGSDKAPTPAEILLAALAACITAGIGNIAAARKVNLTSVTSRVEGDIDLNGLLGLDSRVRNGFAAIRMEVDIEGDAPPEKLAEIVEQSKARSAVFDVLTNGVPVSVSTKRS